MTVENISQALKDRVWTPQQEEIESERRWIEAQVEKIGLEILGRLIAGAKDVRKHAYKPYSGYSVGAGLLTTSGKMHFSINAEAVTYTETDHAERSVITKAISEGVIEIDGVEFIKAVVVSHDGESGPCGGCRQRIAQHAENCLIIDVDGEGNIQAVTSLKLLFPYAFTPSHLEK